MAQAVAFEGCEFEGACDNPDHGHVTGHLDPETCEFAKIEGKKIAVVGTKGIGSCGCTCYVTTGSELWFIEGKAVAREGDRVGHGITGQIKPVPNAFVFTD